MSPLNNIAMAGALLLSAGVAAPGPAAALQATANPWFGTILTDDAGRAVYVTSDARDCIEECQLLWTPVPLEAIASPEASLEAEQFGSTRGPAGEEQATYRGQPLFYFTEDFVPGDTNGQQFEEFGRVGFLITPNGVPFDKTIDDECDCHMVEVARN